MPQVDLDRKFACETTLSGENPPEKSTVSVNCVAAAEAPMDVPPESYKLSKDAESEWFEQNAYYERKDSAKGGLPSSTTNPHANNQSSNSNSQQRFSVNLKSKASIIGLPKTQKAAFADSQRRTCSKPASVRLFPKRGSQSKSTVHQLAEPGSPKVSCMGRVRSKRCRRRSNSVKRDGGEQKKVEERKTGLCSKFLNMFRSKKGHRGKKVPRSRSKRVAEVAAAAEERLDPRRRSTSARSGGEGVAEPPGLGGMKRFASGRRSCSSLTGEEA